MSEAPRVDPMARIGWETIRERLARAVAGEAPPLSPEQAREVLEARARALARVPVRQPDAAEVLEVITFRLANERFAVEMRHVHRLVPLPELTSVPGAPDYLAGVVNYRGEILAVFDLVALLGLVPRGGAELARLVVLGDERADFGFLADDVSEVATLRRSELLEPPGSFAGIHRQYVRGVTAEALIVLDGAILLHDDRLVIDQGE